MAKKLSRGGASGVVIDWSKFDHLFPILPDTAIAEVVGCNRGAVWNRRKKLGIKPPTMADMARLILRLMKRGTT